MAIHARSPAAEKKAVENWADLAHFFFSYGFRNGSASSTTCSHRSSGQKTVALTKPKQNDIIFIISPFPLHMRATRCRLGRETRVQLASGGHSIQPNSHCGAIPAPRITKTKMNQPTRPSRSSCKTLIRTAWKSLLGWAGQQKGKENLFQAKMENEWTLSFIRDGVQRDNSI